MREYLLGMTPTVLITGADRGLGRAFVERFLSEGFRVFAGSHALAVRGEAAREVAPALTELPLDVTDMVLVDQAAEAVGEGGRGLDVLVNNAAVNPERGAALEELDFAVQARVFDVNALGPLRMTQRLLPSLERGAKKTIVNVSSEAGSLTTCGRTSWFGYCMSKAALNMQTRILRNYLGQRGFRVLAVHPGWMRTPMANFEGPLAPETAAASLFRLVVDPNPEPPEFVQHDGTSHPW